MGENLEGLVKFIYGTQAQYDAINSSNYDEDALYFLTDTNKLYKGSTLIANYVNERVIAAALVDLNNTATSLNTKITKNSSDIRDISTRLSDIGEVVQEEIQPLVGQISDISSNLSELDEVFAAVANDLNSRITVNTNNLLDVSTDVETLDRLLAIAANDLNAKISNVSSNVANIVTGTPMVLDLSTRMLDVSSNLEELDFILATVGTQLDQRITDVSVICDQNYSQLNWIVINN